MGEKRRYKQGCFQDFINRETYSRGVEHKPTVTPKVIDIAFVIWIL